MARPQPVLLTVASSHRLSENMQRLTLTANALTTYPDIGPGAYIKLFFDFSGTPLITAPDSPKDAAVRTYTIRALDKTSGTMTVDMVLHGEGGESGPASRWAEVAKPGDQILVGGPGSTKPLSQPADWVLLAGDITALPAISSYLEDLSGDTRGYAVVKVPSPQDCIELIKPEGVSVHWVVEQEGGILADTVSQLTWLEGQPAVWVASEFSDMRELPRLMRNDKNVPHDALYISSYWRRGRSEDQHKVDKKADAEAFAQAG